MGRPKKRASRTVIPEQEKVQSRKRKTVTDADMLEYAGSSSTSTKAVEHKKLLKTKSEVPEAFGILESGKHDIKEKRSPSRRGRSTRTRGKVMEQHQVKVESEAGKNTAKTSTVKQRKSELKETKPQPGKLKIESGFPMTGGGPAIGHKYIGAHVSIAG